MRIFGGRRKEREKRGNRGEVEKEGGGSDGEVIRPIPAAGAPASVQGWLERGTSTLEVLKVFGIWNPSQNTGRSYQYHCLPWGNSSGYADIISAWSLAIPPLEESEELGNTDEMPAAVGE